MSEEKEFDVVLHALQQHRNRLWKMTQQNMTSEFIGMNIMDDIRLQQIDELDEAIKERATPPQRTWVGLTDIDYAGLPLEQVGLVRWAEAKLKEKNT